jgi:hypothetical protein
MDAADRRLRRTGHNHADGSRMILKIRIGTRRTRLVEPNGDGSGWRVDEYGTRFDPPELIFFTAENIACEMKKARPYDELEVAA